MESKRKKKKEKLMSLPSFSFDDDLEMRLDGAVILGLGVGLTHGHIVLALKPFTWQSNLEDKSLLQNFVVDHLILINRSFKGGFQVSSRLWLGVNHLWSVYAMGHQSIQARHIASNANTYNIKMLVFSI